MNALSWTPLEKSLFETGIDRAVVYLPGQPGIPWTGLISVNTDTTSNARGELYIDGQKFSRRSFSEDVSGTIQAYTFPHELNDVLLSDTITKPFGLSYRVKGESEHKIHLLYNILAKQTKNTLVTNVETEFEWTFTTKPLVVPYFKPSSHFILDASIAYPQVVARIEEILYGDEVRTASLPHITELLDIFEEQSVLRIYDHGDGTWSAEGPDDIVAMISEDTFKIDWPSAVYLSTDTYSVHSL